MRRFYFFSLLCLLFSCQTSLKSIQRANDHHKIAVGLISKCDKPRALSHLLKAVKLNPKNFLIRHTLAIVYQSMGQRDKAQQEFKKILKIKPDFTESRVDLARVYIDKNQLNKSLREIKIAEKDITYTNYLKLVGQKALAYYKKGSYRRAKKWLKESLSLPGGKICFIYLYMGKTEMALGHLQSSERFLKKALLACAKEKPLCGELTHEEQLALAQLYIKKGNKQKAKYHLGLFLRKAKAGTDLEKQAKKLLKKLS